MAWFLAQFEHSLLIRWMAALTASALIFSGFWFVMNKLKLHLSLRARKTKTRMDDLVLAALTKTKPILLFAVILSFFVYWLNLPPKIAHAVTVAMKLAVVVQLFLFLEGAINQLFVYKSHTKNSKHSSFALIQLFVRTMLFGFLLILCLDIAGVNVTALIAGLGIGGVAIALALQNILSDLFSSLSILLDKPFEVGDFIAVGNDAGTIEKIGLKTTRVRTLTGDQMVFPNSDLLQSRIRNYARLSERRVVFTLDLDYSTPVEIIETIPERVKKLLVSFEKARFDRSHLSAFAENGYRFETVYWVASNDFNLYMDVQQKLYLGLAKEFEKLDIQFGVPGRSMRFIEKSAPFTHPPKENTSFSRQSHDPH